MVVPKIHKKARPEKTNQTSTNRFLYASCTEKRELEISISY